MYSELRPQQKVAHCLTGQWVLREACRRQLLWIGSVAFARGAHWDSGTLLSFSSNSARHYSLRLLHPRHQSRNSAMLGLLQLPPYRMVSVL